jgi:hypothetical protein
MTWHPCFINDLEPADKWLMKRVLRLAELGDVPDDMIEHADPKLLPHHIGCLRDAESKLRKLRLRMEEALPVRTCRRTGCESPVTGRADARFCSVRCRVTAHRDRSRGDRF